MTSGAHTVSWTGGSVTLQPGRYYLALTASATTGTAVIFGDSAGVTFAGGHRSVECGKCFGDERRNATGDGDVSDGFGPGCGSDSGLVGELDKLVLGFVVAIGFCRWPFLLERKIKGPLLAKGARNGAPTLYPPAGTKKYFFTTEDDRGMRNIGLAVLLMIGLGGLASATTYYVSSSQGNDANSGTSALTAWQTLAHMNAQTFLPGDSILLRRGDVWNESLVPPSSGASGNPITFDAYGTGAPPNLTGYHAIAPTTWVLVTGNAWKTPIPSTFTGISFCLFGTIWGLKVSASTTNLTAKWDFYIAAGSLYVYSAGNPNTFYAGVPIVPMALTNVPVINVNNQSWLTFQHLLVNWYDDFGVYVQGASDHLIFANMEADSMIPEGMG